MNVEVCEFCHLSGNPILVLNALSDYSTDFRRCAGLRRRNSVQVDNFKLRGVSTPVFPSRVAEKVSHDPSCGWLTACWQAPIDASSLPAYNLVGMPELPEVENYRRDLQEALVGRRFTGVSVTWPRQIATPDVETFVSRLPGQTVQAVERRGKFLIFRLAQDVLLIHLRMSGRLLLVPVDTPSDPHVHVRFRLDQVDELRFRDPRKFGRLYLVDDPQRVVGKLGPEPLAEDFTPQRFAMMLAGRRGRIKPLLLNQAFLAGLGNIYTDEALYLARVHPLRAANTLTQEEVKRLHAAIRATLQRAIDQRGTSFDPAYRDLWGDPGVYRRVVYGRAGEPCPRCETPIQRIVVGQRGTYVCPVCQR